jgi:S1-C subfamily serine protease
LDEAVDLALLKIKPKAPLTPAVLGNSDRIRVADEVIAIGSPFGLDQTVSRGIISALRKSLVIEGVTHANLIQTDAAINQGNSGGPLVDANGTVIGINTAIYTPTGAFAGVGFAIPSNQAGAFLRDEIDFPEPAPGAASGRAAAMPPPADRTVSPAGPAIVAGTPSPHTDGRETLQCTTCHQVVARPAGRAVANAMADQYGFAEPPASLATNVAAARGAPEAGYAVMGAGIRAIDPALAERLDHPAGKGVFIEAVVPGSPAAEAGLRPGDIILKVDGRRVRIPRQVAAKLTEAGNGETARLGVLRDGRRRNLTLTVAVLAPGGGTAQRPNARPVPREFDWLGMEIENFIRVLPAAAPGWEGIMGAEISEISRGSPAARAGLRAGDVIAEVNSRPVGTPALLDSAIRGAKGQTDNLLQVIRNDRDFFVVIP